MPPTKPDPARLICSFCDNLSKPGNTEVTAEIRHQFFHKECSSCTPQQDLTLCDFCQHLRVSHLFFCDLTTYDDFLDLEITSYFDLSISPSQSCPFCQLLTYITDLGKSYFPGIKEEINKRCIKTYLRLIWDPHDGQMRLELCVGLVFYPILLAEKICRWNKSLHALNLYQRLMTGYNRAPLHVGKKVRWDQVCGWLKECANHHHECSEKRLKLDERLKRLPDGFMLIDVKERKIVNGDKGFQFVALSYVWGNKPNDAKLRATAKTIKRLRCRNGVAAHELPATIEDAIQICIKLGERYLWVDRLCIVQDHHQNKQHQISRMASIYASASFVIVATEGDMESGIAGVSHERPIQHFQPVSGSMFSYGLPSMGESIEHSRWATRGWTYQEAVLASKKLFFTSNQVYYMCECTIRSENIDERYEKTSFTERSMSLNAGVVNLFENWKHHLEAYTARSLSHSSDIYNAFIGICSAIYIEDDPLLCGLPRQSFNQALLWSCTKPAEDAPPHQVRTPEKDEQLPSWSWSSVIGKVSLNEHDTMTSEFCGSLVEWAVKRSGKSHLERIWCPDDPQNEVPPNHEQLNMAIAWSQGCLKKPWPLPQLFELEFSSLNELMKTRRIFARDHIQEWEDFGEELQKELLKNRRLLDKMLLVSRAQTAHFRLKNHRPHFTPRHHLRDPKHHLLEVVDEEGHCIGMMAESEPRVKGEVWPSIELDVFEFVALSISCYDRYHTPLRSVLQRNEQLLKDWQDLKDYRKRKEEPRGIFWQRSRNLTFYDRHGVPLEQIPVVNVMLIGRDPRHRHLAHRVSVGWILLTQWAKAERQFETIILE